MNQIKDPPLTYDFGLDFNYAVWTPGTTVTLCNVPWNNDYRDIVKFANRSALNSYISGLSGASINLGGMSYVKQGQPIRINVPFNNAYKYNYLRASNPVQPIPGSDTTRDYYYFITDVRYLAPNTTEIIVQLDVWQTFGYDIQFGNCYVERGHIGIANEAQFTNYGRDYLTVPEGLDLGSELQIIKEIKEYIITVGSVGGVTDWMPNVVVASTVDLFADPGTIDSPKLVTAKGGVFQGVPSGASIYAFETGSSFRTWLTANQNKPWVTQGIISATLVPNIERYWGSGGITWPASGTPVEVPSTSANTKGRDMDTNWRSRLTANLPARYQHLKKFLTSPYSILELTMLTGNPVVIKPELWNDADAPVVEHCSIIPPGQKITVYPQYYNTNKSGPTEFGETFDHATHVGAFITLAVVNNGSIAYLAQNRNSIAYQRESSDWTQQRALGSNQAQYDVQTQGIETSRNLNAVAQIANSGQTAIANQLASNQAQTNLVGSGLAGAAGGAVLGPAGMAGGAIVGTANGIVGAIQTGHQIAANDQSSAMRNSTMGAQNAIETRQQGFARDTNKNLADWAARGDYANSIAGVNAKVRDAAMISPSVSGQMGGETINMQSLNFAIVLRFKMPDMATIRSIGEYWLRYGYMVHKFMKPPTTLMAMAKFTYWKMSETYIIAAPMPETYKQTIRGIFEKGVTVWASPADIGNIDIADNAVVPGLSY
jgi:hypothetical protein